MKKLTRASRRAALPVAALAMLIGLGRPHINASALRIMDPVRREQVYPGKGLEQFVQMMPSADASETGNFDNLVPKYVSPTKLKFEGQIYTYYGTAKIDWDENGTKETTIQFYKVGSDRKIINLITKGKTWGWGVYRVYGDKNSSENFSIYDLDGNGKFETKAKTSEDIPFPAYLAD